MATIREYQIKIGSLKNSRKITGSMKMISSIKLQKVGTILEQSVTFRKTARHLQQKLCSVEFPGTRPLVGGSSEVRDVDMLLITGDRGLCGRFNTNVITHLMQKLKHHEERPVTVNLYSIGLRGDAFFKRRGHVFTPVKGITANPTWSTISELSAMFYKRFTTGQSQEFWVVYTRRVTSMAEEPCSECLLPLIPSADQKPHADYLIEDTKGFADRAGRIITDARLFDVVIESVYAEHAARMSAMDNANANCDRLIDKYTQLRNRARQAVITTELNEIVTGKEALET